jgi:hypothetical protein
MTRPAISFSIATISRICRRNHGSIAVSSYTSSTVIPARNASPTAKMRSGVGVRSIASIFSGAVCRVSRPATPISSERNPFCSASLNVRPMAIASPTDCIEKLRSGVVLRNFSKAKRGIFTTT